MIPQAHAQWGRLSALAEEVVATGHRPSITIGGRDTGSTHSCTDTPRAKLQAAPTKTTAGLGEESPWPPGVVARQRV